MMRSSGTFLLLALALSGPCALAQTRPKKPYVPKFQLAPGTATPLGGLPWMSTLGPVRCDSGADLYIRLEPSHYQPRPFSVPVAKFSPDGEKLAVYSLEKAAGWSPGDIMDFTIGQDGTVYLLADHVDPNDRKKLIVGILSFDGDGDYRSAVRLHLPVQYVERLAAFSTGLFLVTGVNKVKPPTPQIPGTPVKPKELENKQEESPLEPTAFVVDRRGEVLKKVMLPEDPLSVKNGKAYGPALQFSGSTEGLQGLASGNQGEVYVMYPTAEPIVYAISAAGDIVRSFVADLPSHYTPMTMKWAWGFDGLLLQSGAIKHHGILAKDMLFSVIDPHTGHAVAEYRTVGKLGVVPACFTQHNIYFLGADKGKLVIREADVQ